MTTKLNPVFERALQKYSEPLVVRLIQDFFKENEAGMRYLQILQNKNLPLVIDHLTIRCMDIDLRAQEFLRIGYLDKNEIIEYPEQGWWARIYRKENYPVMFIDQPYSDQRGKKSPLTPWVKKFGDQVLHHVAVLVTDIDQTKKFMEDRGIEFSGEISGARGSRLRQIFTAAELKDESPFSVLELTERNHYDGFYPEQADNLMKSSVKTKSPLI